MCFSWVMFILRTSSCVGILASVFRISLLAWSSIVLATIFAASSLCKGGSARGGEDVRSKERSARIFFNTGHLLVIASLGRPLFSNFAMVDHIMYAVVDVTPNRRKTNQAIVVQPTEVRTRTFDIIIIVIVNRIGILTIRRVLLPYA